MVDRGGGGGALTKFSPRDALLASLMLLAPGAACAQELVIPTVAYPSIAPSASTAEGFIPKGWRIEARETGDTNGDGRGDLGGPGAPATARPRGGGARHPPPHRR